MKQEKINKDRRTSPTYVGENLGGSIKNAPINPGVYSAANPINKSIKNAPINPGVYYFKDSLGKIIYIGKAKNLRNRLKSYTYKPCDLAQNKLNEKPRFLSMAKGSYLYPSRFLSMAKGSYLYPSRFLSMAKGSYLYPSRFLSMAKGSYIGKAKNLRNRLKSYSAKNVSAKTAKMLLVAHDLTWEITTSELEALVLESKKIREIKPFYNISLKDDKRYTYVYFTDDKFPRIALSHGKPANQNLVSIGPYTNRTMISLVLKEIRKTISFCTCKKNHKKICSNAQMGLCPGYCCSTEMIESIKESDLEKYRRKYLKNINEIMLVLGGRKNGTLSKLEKRITIYIRKEKFEKAKRIKNLERET